MIWGSIHKYSEYILYMTSKIEFTVTEAIDTSINYIIKLILDDSGK